MLRFLITLTYLNLLIACDSNTPAITENSSEIHPRIITLAPHLAELVVSAGAIQHLVGVTEYSDFPKEVKKIQRIGDAFLVDFETIVKLKPDLVITWKGGTSRSVLNQLKEYNIETLPIEIKNLKDIPNSVKQIAELTKTLTLAEPNIRKFNDQLIKFQNIPRVNKKTFIQLSDQPLFTVSGKHWMSEAIGLCGMENIFSEMKQSSSPVNIESVLQNSPEAVLNVNTTQTQIWDQFKHESSKFQARVINIDPTLLSIPSFRIMEGIKKLCTNN